MHNVRVPEVRRHHGCVVIGGLRRDLHLSLGEKVPDGLQVPVGGRDAQKLALEQTEQERDLSKTSLLGVAKTTTSKCS